uniref:Acyl-CoA-delta-6-desaturase n=1 Tax=Antheraea pernyi TaxID=7119 RepID=E3TMU9_ANTPE|nr:acyl-CoA-delta-6-desaturase [Antheraea pernyi]
MKIIKFDEILRRFERVFAFDNDIKWGSVFVIFGYHALAVYWCYNYSLPVKWQTVIFAYCTYVLSGMGITLGVHRYWSHRCFKATKPLQIILFLMFALTGQTSIRIWVRNHRLHHKASDTPGDPHNATRGLFYSHIGWLMMKKTDQLIEQGKKIDMRDIDSDPLLRWYDRNVFMVNLMAAFVLPTMVNIWCLGESWRCAVAWQCFVRYLGVLHAQMTINSLAHKFGNRPFNSRIKPAENMFVSYITFGEGFHNYHHVFPYDYRTTGDYFILDYGKILLKFFEKIGWAYNLRKASPETIASAVGRLNCAESDDLLKS